MSDLSNKVTFEQRPRSERAISVDTGGKSIPGRGNGLYKGEQCKDQQVRKVKGIVGGDKRRKRPDSGNH